MPTVSFTTRIDRDLKSRLDKIAEYEDRSASYIANQAIRSLVEEREATYALIATGMSLIDKNISVSEDAVHAWLEADEDMPFPAPELSKK